MAMMLGDMKGMPCVLLALGLWLLGPASVSADLTMKILIVNPSETETKEFEIRNPLPPEVKPEHVLDTSGLKVDYDSQVGTYMLIGSVTLKPKEAVTKRILLEDVWVIPPERFTALRRELGDILEKLEGTSYRERGDLLANAVQRKVDDVEASQEQPFFHPVQHINRYREDVKKLEIVETDLVSLRQLMVMAALQPPKEEPSVLSGAPEPAEASGPVERGALSVLTTWRLIFIILGLLGFVSLSFFLVWQRQLKLQLSKQAEEVGEAPEDLLSNGNGAHAADGTTPTTPRLQPKT